MATALDNIIMMQRLVYYRERKPHFLSVGVTNILAGGWIFIAMIKSGLDRVSKRM